MGHPYRPEKDLAEKAQQEAAQQLQSEFRLAQARPAETGESTGQLSLLEDKALRKLQAELPETSVGSEAVQAEAHLRKVTQPLWKVEGELGYNSPEYRARVEQFQRDFAGKSGVVEVARDALDGNNAIYRSSAAHQIDVACRLGRERVECFEDPIAVGDKHAVDIVTTDHLAIKCKAATGEAISSGSIYKGIHQGELYLDSDKYQAAVVVRPDGTLKGAGQETAWGRELYSDVQVCEISDLQKTAEQVRMRV